MKPNRCVRFCEHHERPPVQRLCGQSTVRVEGLKPRLGFCLACSPSALGKAGAGRPVVSDQVIEGGGERQQTDFLGWNAV